MEGKKDFEGMRFGGICGRKLPEGFSGGPPAAENAGAEGEGRGSGAGRAGKCAAKCGSAGKECRNKCRRRRPSVPGRARGSGKARGPGRRFGSGGCDGREGGGRSGGNGCGEETATLMPCLKGMIFIGDRYLPFFCGKRYVGANEETMPGGFHGNG